MSTGLRSSGVVIRYLKYFFMYFLRWGRVRTDLSTHYWTLFEGEQREARRRNTVQRLDVFCLQPPLWEAMDAGETGRNG